MPREVTPATLPQVSAQSKPATLLPPKLAHLAEVCFEEEQYSKGISFLLNTTSYGSFILPPVPLGLIATLLVHPRADAETNEAELSVRLAAEQLLADLVNRGQDKWFEAWSSMSKGRAAAGSRGSRARRDAVILEGSDAEDDDHERLGPLGGGESVFARVDSIWNLLGFGLWTSCASGPSSQQWQLWRRLVLHVIQVLEHDLGDGREVQGSLVMQYLRQADPTRPNFNAALRTIFANDKEEDEAYNNWRDPYPDHKLRKQPSSSQTDEASQMTSSQLISSQISTSQRSAKERSSSMTVDDEALEIWGGLDSLNIRTRLISILFTVASATNTVDTLITSLSSYITPLPPSQFCLWVRRITLAPGNTARKLHIHLALLQSLASFSGAGRGALVLNEDFLVSRVLPCTARRTTSLVDVARISFLVESFFRTWLVLNSPLKTGREELRDVVEKGTENRKAKLKAKSQPKSRGGTPTEEIEEECWRLINMTEMQMRIIDDCATVEK
ncbi:hypothetical protein SAICODRAFT_29354 [Saitoella complicata NRRL Y-17804]|uniref:uncharacterized protein n=1 Tax=Saitoella complicata (strain BCRC 22490 / CBS 7301 / JCM 7358 / NBRC 10748 / NRRL Y-17804) TaxID=698492 RepID=UPI0008675DB4|nr:uncharacterized protein SAICODRAFT_29354 [Saitoella complicata NRRL Y-17804]ODQ54650.1 hypothetical protein SAICODRAFT_29354 [Saitoella complicata NRRL Y-17804]